METANSNIKRLVATDIKYHKAPVFIVPKNDPRTREVKDYVKLLPEDLQKQVTVNLKPKTDRDDKVVDELQIRAYHLMVFDLTNANDALFFEIVKEDSMIAPSKDKVNPDQHRFYIEDKEREATVKISKAKLKGKAFAVIAGLSLEQQTNYAKILGKWTKDLSGTQVEGVLYEVAEDNPQLILDVDNDKDLKYKIFLKKALEKGILYMDNGKYMNQKDLIGINEEYAIMWLKNPENNVVVTQWNRMMTEAGSSYEPKIEETTGPVTDAVQPSAPVEPTPAPQPVQNQNPDPTPEAGSEQKETIDEGSQGQPEGGPGAPVDNNDNNG